MNKELDKSAKLNWFEFDNKKFSLSIPAQMNINRILLLYITKEITTDQMISTYTDDVYTLKCENIPKFVGAMHNTIESELSRIRSGKFK